MSSRWATAGVFAVNGAAIGTWVAHIRAGGFGLVILESVAEAWELVRDDLFRVRFEMRI